MAFDKPQKEEDGRQARFCRRIYDLNRDRGQKMSECGEIVRQTRKPECNTGADLAGSTDGGYLCCGKGRNHKTIIWKISKRSVTTH